MLQVHNFTPFRTQRAILLDKDGAQVWTVVVKGTYTFDDAGKVALAEEQEPVCVGPEYFGEPGLSSLRREAELTPEHIGTDVVVNASAYAPRGKVVPSLNVAIEVAGMRRVLTVSGPRVWRTGPLGLRKSSPEPFVSMPIVYERAYGGQIAGLPNALEPRNPVGTGFAQDASQLEGRPLPNIEDFEHPIEHWKDRPMPAGLGAIAPHWSPRRELAGTFDDKWHRTRAPFWPSDHNPLFHRSASPGLWSQQPLRGNERVAMVGLVPAGSLSFHLPHEAFMVETRVAGRRIAQPPPQLDRVLIDVDQRKVVMVWAARLPCGVRARQVEFTSVDLKQRIA